jgi:type I site-specific restriction endonuclease
LELIQTRSQLLQAQEKITKGRRNSWRRYCHESRAMLIKIMAKRVTSKINNINYLTPWSRILLEKLNILWLVKKFLGF